MDLEIAAYDVLAEPVGDHGGDHRPVLRVRRVVGGARLDHQPLGAARPIVEGLGVVLRRGGVVFHGDDQ